jgi:hypothetical protein
MILAMVCDTRPTLVYRPCIPIAMAVVLLMGTASVLFAQIDEPPPSPANANVRSDNGRAATTVACISGLGERAGFSIHKEFVSAKVSGETASLTNPALHRLFGTDTVAPAGPAPYYAVFEIWAPIWRLLTPDASLKVRKGNYERIFDEGRRKVRAWEKANAA